MKAGVRRGLSATQSLRWWQRRRVIKPIALLFPRVVGKFRARLLCVSMHCTAVFFSQHDAQTTRRRRWGCLANQ